MKRISLLPLTVLLFIAMIGFKTEENTLNIQLYKENTNQNWTEIKGLEFDAANNPVIHLENDSYYTLRIAGSKEYCFYKTMTAILGDKTNEKKYNLNLETLIANNHRGVENYFTELPCGLVSFERTNINNTTVYTLLIKTKVNN